MQRIASWLTLKAVGVEQVFAFLVRLDATLRTADALPRQTPQQSLALEAVSRRRRAPDDEVVRRRARDRVDERLQRLLVHVLFLCTSEHTRSCCTR